MPITRYGDVNQPKDTAGMAVIREGSSKEYKSRGGVKTSPQQPSDSKNFDKHSLGYALRTGLAGGLAGCAAKTLVGPLDRVKILFQASNPQFAKYTGSWLGVFIALKDINRSDGIRGLFRGHSATLLRIFPYAAIKFLAYEQIRARIIKEQSQETSFRRLVSGSLAGVTSVFFTYPLEVLRVRLAFETKHDSKAGLSRICRQIYHEGGPNDSRTAGSWAGKPTDSAESVSSSINATLPTIKRASPWSRLSNFYRGFAPTLLGMLPYAGMSFLTHDTARDWLRSPSLAPYTTISGTSGSSTDYGAARLTNTAELFSGALAGLISQTASYPLEVIRRRMQVSGAVGDGQRLHIWETANKIWIENGTRGFFVGLTIGYMKVIPMVAVSFWVYERGKVALGI